MMFTTPARASARQASWRCGCSWVSPAVTARHGWLWIAMVHSPLTIAPWRRLGSARHDHSYKWSSLGGRFLAWFLSHSYMTKAPLSQTMIRSGDLFPLCRSEPAEQHFQWKVAFLVRRPAIVVHKTPKKSLPSASLVRPPASVSGSVGNPSRFGGPGKGLLYQWCHWHQQLHMWTGSILSQHLQGQKGQVNWLGGNTKALEHNKTS